MNITSAIRHSKLSALLLAACYFIPSASAQTAPAASSANNPASDSVELARFVVSTEKDNGYIAADTLNAGRLSTNVLMTPSDVTVLTRQFIDDIGAFDMVEAASWLTSSHPNELGSGSSADLRDFGTGTTQRGMITQRNTRNYFSSSFTPEEYFVERVEGARGPNAILYGDGGPGGQVNYLTKKALTHEFQRVRFRADSEGTTEFTADVNEVLSDKLAVRFNGRLYRGKSWMERFYDNRSAGAVSLSYRPWKGGEIRVEGELNYSNRMHRTDNYQDRASNWSGVGLENAAVPTSGTPVGVTRFSATTPTWIYIEGLGLMDWRGYGRSNGTGLALLPDGDTRGIANFPVLPRREFNSQPNQMRLTQRFTDAAIFFEQSFASGLVTEVAFDFNRSARDGQAVRYDNAYIDVNKTLPTGGLNPYYGKFYSLANYDFDIDGTTDTWYAGRVAANYPIKIGKIVQNVSVVGQKRQQQAFLRNHQAYRTDSVLDPLRSAANVITIQRYWDNLPKDIPTEFEGVPLKSPLTRDTDILQKLDSFQVNTVGSYFNNRLSVVAGVRRDKYNSRVSDIATVDRLTAEILTRTNVVTKAYADSRSAGVVYFPIKQLGAYVNYSEGFVAQTSSNLRIDGSSFTDFIVPSEVISGGMRFKFFDGKMVGSAGYYESKETNRLLGINVRDVNDLWTRHGRDPLVTFANTQIVDFQSIEGKGWEAEATATFSNAFRVTANIAFPQTKQSDTGREYRAYVAENLSTWQGYANDPNNPTRAADATSIANIMNTLSSFNEGRVQNGTYDYRANIFGNYTFRTGALKGLGLGGGMQFFGERLIGNKIGEPYNYVYADAYQVASASVSYPFTWNDRKITVQLNVVNLLDYDDPIFATVAVAGGTLYRNAYRYQTPRMLRLTATLNF